MINETTKFKSYGVFDKTTKERVAVIKSTKKVYDNKEGSYTFYLGNTPIAKTGTKKHFIYELL